MDFVVRMKGLEPPRLSALEPKSRASTNSATSASPRQSHESHHPVNLAAEMMFRRLREEVLKISAAYDKRRGNCDGRERTAIGRRGKTVEEQRLT